MNDTAICVEAPQNSHYRKAKRYLRFGMENGMKKNIIRIAAALVCIIVIVGCFWWATNHKRASQEDQTALTEVQKITTKNLEKNYPGTPREVIKLYNRIVSCFYGEDYTEEELYELGDQARMLFDEELLGNNSRDDYFANLNADIAEYREKSKTIASTSVCSSNDVKYQTVDGDECAYVTTSYFINENKTYSRTYQTYVLRKDEDGNWKILVFYQTEGESAEDE